MDKSSIASAIFAAYPQNFKEQIAGVDVSELSAKYKLKPAGKNQVYNVTVRIKFVGQCLHIHALDVIQPRAGCGDFVVGHLAHLLSFSCHG